MRIRVGLPTDAISCSSGARDWGTGLMVVDTATGTYRMLLRGLDVRVPDWSPSLGWDGS